MGIKKHVEVIADDDGHVLFMGVASSGKTSALLKALQQQVLSSGETVWVVDPQGDIARAVNMNLDGLPMAFLKTLRVVEKVRDLPSEIPGILAIDDGCGYFSLVEHEDHFKKLPYFVFCTVQVNRPAITL